MRTSNGSKVVRELDTWLGLGRRAYARASCEQEFATECDHRGLSGSRTIGAKDCRLHGCSTWRPAATGAPVHPISIPDSEKLWGEGFNFHILSVGTLKAPKDHATLIRAFALLPESLSAKLIILGEGQLRGELEDLIRELGLQDKVHLPGFMIDPSPWFRSADLFVLSSLYEGFGNVIVEALECGVPVVSTDCPSGPAEILDHGRIGKLVPIRDQESLSRAMTASYFEEHDRRVLMDRAKDFSIERISVQYLDYFWSE